MKKIVALLIAFVCLLTLVACDQSQSSEDSSENKVVYGEKYILSSDVNKDEDEMQYYIFEDKEYLQHHYYYHSSSYGYTNHYTMRCRYEIMDDGTLAYFYDSVTIHDDNTREGGYSTGKSGILLFSENVVTTQAGDLYIRESFLEDELKNFSKKSADDSSEQSDQTTEG